MRWKTIAGQADASRGNELVNKMKWERPNVSAFAGQANIISAFYVNGAAVSICMELPENPLLNKFAHAFLSDVPHL